MAESVEQSYEVCTLCGQAKPSDDIVVAVIRIRKCKDCVVSIGSKSPTPASASRRPPMPGRNPDGSIPADAIPDDLNVDALRPFVVPRGAEGQPASPLEGLTPEQKAEALEKAKHVPPKDLADVFSPPAGLV